MNSNDEVYDIIIIGGGAVGAYTALDATLRGYRVLLVEKMILQVVLVLKVQSWFMGSAIP